MRSRYGKAKATSKPRARSKSTSAAASPALRRPFRGSYFKTPKCILLGGLILRPPNASERGVKTTKKKNEASQCEIFTNSSEAQETECPHAWCPCCYNSGGRCFTRFTHNHVHRHASDDHGRQFLHGHGRLSFLMSGHPWSRLRYSILGREGVSGANVSERKFECARISRCL